MKRFLIGNCSVFRKSFAIATTLLFVLSSTSLWAATAAYYRHEEGTVGGLIPNGPNTVLDSSGNDNHMQTFNSATTSATYTSTVSPLALRSGFANNLSLDFGPGGDDAGLDDDNYTQDKPIQTQLFTAMTVELAFNMNAVGAYQNLFGKDGKPLGDDEGEPDEPVAPLQIKIRGDNFPNAVPNQLFVEFIDGDGDIHFLAGGETIVAGEWNHIAFTLTATAAELWVAGETGDYVLADAISGDDFAGALGPGEVTIFDPTPITVGRGMFNNGVTDWSDALIDEVRVSDTALLPTEFLFVTAPGGTDGDFDGDGDADGRDFLLWQRGGSPDPFSPGDLAEWQGAYGGGGLSAISVPEPTTSAILIGLLGVGASTLVSRRRKA